MHSGGPQEYKKRKRFRIEKNVREDIFPIMRVETTGSQSSNHPGETGVRTDAEKVRREKGGNKKEWERELKGRIR